MDYAPSDPFVDMSSPRTFMRNQSDKILTGYRNALGAPYLLHPKFCLARNNNLTSLTAFWRIEECRIAILYPLRLNLA